MNNLTSVLTRFASVVGVGVGLHRRHHLSVALGVLLVDLCHPVVDVTVIIAQVGVAAEGG